MGLGRFRQVHTAFACGFGSLIMGLLNVWPSYTSELYFSNTTTPLSTPMTKAEESLLGSLPSLGAMVGCAIAGVLINNLGRRNGGVVLSLPVLLSWAIISVTTSMKLVLAARFVSGISGGAFLVVAPIFISEVVEDSIRGTLASASVFLYCTGTLLSYIIGWCFTYRTIIWLNLVFCVAATVLILLVTESPVYLLRQKREEDAKLSIAKYRGAPVSSMIVLDELTRLKQQVMPSVELVSITETDPKAEEAEKEKLKLEENLDLEKPQATSSFKLLFVQPASRWAFMVVMTVISMQVFMGIVPVQVYAKTVFTETDPSKADMYTVLFAVVQFSGSAVTGAVADKAGRRILIISSSVLVFLSMMSLGCLMQFKAGPPILTVILIFAYCFSFMFGAGSIPYVLLAEAFIPEVQNLASMIIIEWVWFLNFLIIAVFPYLNTAFGMYGVFYLFGVMGLANSIIGYFIVPETKGLSNAQIQDLFLSRKKH
ncbi:facilitated trehalose transporter Tret1-2 homolog [Anticarsia gemmatalis]|uniref:facilitated trehalose transporter Tret1-2 homolog n=1 Tax=Anticarsia gemmatalis TaxID=129554 RepID=UPI003F76E8CA